SLVAPETNNIVTMAGQALDIGDGRLATNAQLLQPSGLAFDPDHNLYVIELSGNRVRRVDKTTKVITTVAGTGLGGLSGDGGPATAAQINTPRGIAFDSLGNLYIADLNNSRVRKVDKMTGIITTVAGTTPGFQDGLATTEAQLNQPSGIAFDASG